MTALTRRNANLAILMAAISLAPRTIRIARADEGTRSIKHQSGTTEISGKPQRVVALEFSFVQTLDILGVTPLGISDDNQRERIDLLLGRSIDYASVGTRLEPNLELVASLMPDLILADERRHSAIYDQLSAIAPTIVLDSWEGDYATIKSSTAVIARSLGEEEKGRQALANHETAMAALAARIPAGEQRRVLLAVATPDSMSLHTSSSFAGSVFTAIGLTPAVSSPAPLENGAGLERLIAIKPDILLVATEASGTVLYQWKENTAWGTIPAVRNGMMFEVDRNRFARFRGLQTAEWIAREILAKVYKAG